MKYSAINSTNTIRTFISSTGKKGNLHFVFILSFISLFLTFTACDNDGPLSPKNSVPIAKAGSNQVVYQGIAVSLDGSASGDSDGDNITFAWTFTSMPEGSAVTLSGANTATPSFTPDKVGLYQLELTVSDGTDSDTDRIKMTAYDASYTFSAPVFDIAAAPEGRIFVAETVMPGNEPSAGQSVSVIKQILKGAIEKIGEIQTMKGSPINGLASVGGQEAYDLYASSGALDRATGGKLFYVGSSGQAMADIGAFERKNDPDATFGPQWKDPRCEVAPFSPGPQSNPYHLTMLSSGTALVADAAGNTLLSVKTGGEIELVAVFTPPTADGSSSSNPADWLVLFELKDGTDCYVQPVPTSVAIGPDGDYYVGELTGAVAEGLPTGLSRVWRIEADARNVVCPSEDCQVVISGLTSVIDVAFGPHGNLYVLEYDKNSWLAPFIPAIAGGTLKRCDAEAGTCENVATNLVLPGAITFDTRGDLWVLENNIGIPKGAIGFPTDNTGVPTVRLVDLL